MSDDFSTAAIFGRRARIGALSAVTAVAATAGAFGATAASAAPAKPAGGHCSPSVSSQYFGSTVEPYTGKNTAVYRYTLSNCQGMTAKILSYGGIVQYINVPSRSGGQVTDVMLGFKTLADYVKYDSPPVTANGGPYFGESSGAMETASPRARFAEPAGCRTRQVHLADQQ